MKTKRMITAVLSAAMILSAVPVMAETDTDTVVYSYTNENGALVEVTQAELDAEHWNKDALGDIAPVIYESFPMKMTGFSNDFGELSLDLEYLKELADMDNVHLEIRDLNSDTIIYDKDLDKVSFYSPTLEVGGQYEVILTETIDGTTSEYVRVVFAEKSTETLPDCIVNPSTDNDENILIADVDRLRAGISVKEDGSMEINRSVATYDSISAGDFTEYCNTLASNKLYRVYTNINDVQYAGYISTAEGNVEAYDLVINTYTWDDLYAPSIASLPSGISSSNIENYAVDLGLTDAAFSLDEDTNNSKFSAYRVLLPINYVNGTKTGEFAITVTGSAKISAKIWRDAGTGNLATVRTMTSSNSENTVTFSIDTSDYDVCDYLDFYVMVYFPSAVEGYGMINFEAVSNFTDDVTGSVYKAYTEESMASLNNTEFSIYTASDIDAFAFQYYGTKAATYKVTVKNRSLDEQENLESGVSGVEGSAEKYLTFWRTLGSTFTRWVDTATYTIPENADITVYNEITSTGDEGFRIYRNILGSSSSASPYQLEFKKLG